MARRKNGETRRRWQELVRQQAASGLSVREFCEQEQISRPSFYAWRRRLAQQAGSVVQSPATGGDREEPHAMREFIPVRLLDTPSAWEVVHPGGCRVRVSGEVSATALQCIVEVLDGRTGR
jgi:transposase-like protein